MVIDLIDDPHFLIELEKYYIVVQFLVRRLTMPYVSVMTASVRLTLAN